MNTKKKVVVGLSGGVDSAVSAHLLKESGFEVIGVTMQIWEKDADNDSPCCGYSAIQDAQNVAHFIGIDHYILNFREDFKKYVIDYFIDEYQKGRTPNPCIACNKYIKWQSLLQKARLLKADYIATGHYAKIAQNETGRYTLQVSADNTKDQTYALYNLTQEQLAYTMFPLGGYTKEKVRAIALEIGLNIANKPDSQEICFVPDNNYGAYLAENIDKEIAVGNFVDIDGNILGAHKGLIYYTIGQRKNLGIAFGKPMYVKELRVATNEVVLADDKDLFCDSLEATRLNFVSMAREDISDDFVAYGKIRYSHKPSKCMIKIDGDKLYCKFDVPQRAITPGQAAVFYDEGGYVICGGVIDR